MECSLNIKWVKICRKERKNAKSLKKISIPVTIEKWFKERKNKVWSNLHERFTPNSCISVFHTVSLWCHWKIYFFLSSTDISFSWKKPLAGSCVWRVREKKESTERQAQSAYWEREEARVDIMAAYGRKYREEIHTGRKYRMLTGLTKHRSRTQGVRGVPWSYSKNILHCPEWGTIK